jgi:zinc protease
MRQLFILISIFLLNHTTIAKTTEYKLDNGLKLIVKEDHRAPVVVSMIWYKVGSSDEPGGITGISHALEHMMFKGTKKYPTGIFSKIIAENGGRENAFTNTDYTAYFEQLAAKRLAISFELEADRMTNLLLSPKEFAKEIKVIQEERRMRTDDNPQALSFERFMAAAHLASPYQHPVIGWMNDLINMNINDLTQWYQRYYTPNNATLVVVGDVNPEKTLALAKKYFSAIKPRNIKPKKPQLEPRPLGEKHINVSAPAKLPFLMLGYSAPSVKTAKESWKPYAFEVLAGILGGGESARLAKDVVRGSQIATFADVYYNLYARYDTQFIIYGTPSQKHTPLQLKKAFIAQLNALKKEKVPDAELQRIKNQIIAQKIFEKDSIFGQAMEIGLLETVGLSHQESEQYIKKINAITSSQLRQVAIELFNNKRLTSTLLTPENNKRG